MSYFSNAHHFRKTLAGFCMMLAPLSLLIGMIVLPGSGTSERSMIAAAAASPDAWLASHLLFLAALALVLPATLGLMHMLRERQVALGHVGGALALLGILAFVGIMTVQGLVGWQAGAGDRAEMVALFERLNDSTGYMVPFTIGSLGFVVGLVLLSIGLYRARAVQSTTALCVGLAAILLAIAMVTANELLGIVSAAVMLIGFGAVGRAVLAESDEEWEHTPEYAGFRSLAGMR